MPDEKPDPKDIAIKRATLQCQALTQRIEQIKSSIDDFDPEHDDEFFLEEKLRAINAAQLEYNAHISELYVLVPVADCETLVKSVVETQEIVDDVSMSIRRQLSRLKKDRPPQPNPEAKNRIRLPEIPLPTFNGDYNEWVFFRERFATLIAEQPALTEAEKHIYLRSALRGEAKRVESVNDTYQSLWAALEKRYEMKRVIADKHISELHALSAMSQESAVDLRSLLDTMIKNVRVLDTIDLKLNTLSEMFLINILCSRLDSETRKAFQQTLKPETFPTWDSAVTFFQQHAHMLESIELSKRNPKSKPTAHSSKSNGKVPPRQSTLHVAEKAEFKCAVCEKRHKTSKCFTFQKLSVKERLEKVEALKLCRNCLSPNHRAKDCQAGKCYRCEGPHHTLLHEDAQPEPKNAQPEPNNASHVTVDTPATTLLVTGKYIVLSTVVLNVYDVTGVPITCRALLDNASQPNLVTDNFAQRLKAKKIRLASPVNGVGVHETPVRHKIAATIKSRTSPYSVSLDFHVMSTITTKMPAVALEPQTWNIPKNLILADPLFHVPQRVDMLLGAEIYYDVITNRTLKLQQDLPHLIETVFGWAVGGKIDPPEMGSQSANGGNFCGCVTSDLSYQVKRFWELEACEPKKYLTPNERKVEEHFEKTVRRQPDGRYVVQLPLKSSVDKLGDSRFMAAKRYKSLERKFSRDDQLKANYTAFIDEYSTLDHMELSPKYQLQQQYFLPHHAVLKPDSVTTKLRVVFDGSAVTSSGLSLNDVLMVGPTVQQELFEIIVRFRKHQYAFTADICKMYRQVNIDPSQQSLQQILWRPSPDSEIKSFSLKTVTYGTASAPYLATRALQQLAMDEKGSFSAASIVTQRDFYVDDVLSGANSLPEAEELQKQLSAMLKKGGFELHKWCSNSPLLLNQLNDQHQVQISDNHAVKTLGLSWHPKEDCFMIKTVKEKFCEQPVTKRTVLANIASLFDPLGLANPIVVTAKLILQDLWRKETEWDDLLDQEDHEKWVNFRTQLNDLQEIKVPRRVIPSGELKSIKLLGFCDASSLAYGACVYIRCTDMDDRSTTNLLCAKSRIAPLQATTIPRLELCAAQLLAQLVTKVEGAMQISFDDRVLWTDSTIVLSWIRSQSSQMKIFVANRISDIHDLTVVDNWRHIASEENPADIVSRGVNPNELQPSRLWWFGPSFINEPESQWPNSFAPLERDELPEMKIIKTSLVIQQTEELPVFEKFSNFGKLQRVITNVLKFIRPRLGENIKRCQQSHSARVKNNKKDNEKNNEKDNEKDSQISENNKNQKEKIKEHRRGENINVSQQSRFNAVQTQNTNHIIFRYIQQMSFSDEIKAIRDKKPVPRRSTLHGLSAFLDENGVLRVGGRLRHSNEHFDTKHQIVLPRHHVTTILIRSLHEENGHVGQQALLSMVRQQYWPIGAKNTIKGIVRNCIKCFRCRPRSADQVMGDLPECRTTICQPFVNVGTDYAGPLTLKINRKTSIKAYVAIFVCMATKAVHIELVTDLTTGAFLAALDRFVSRRGLCQNIHCDNGTNFVGARNELAALYKMVHDKSFQDAVCIHFANKPIQFHFIPPRSPHFGGLWEAAVKSTKYHLVRIVGGVSLNFEEMVTVLAKIEAILNSRPLIPESNDPDDPTSLTPGHFLIGRPLMAMIEPNLANVNINTLRRWQLLQHLSQHFWNRWSKEYLTSLQRRTTGTDESTVFRVGMLVVLKDDNLPPTQWNLGRIAELLPGADGRVRVVQVRTKTGIYKRAVTKLCVLPIES